MQDACKGLSRLIQIDRGDDIELFAHQLRASDRAASQRYSIIDNNVPCFAISYVQHAPVGRFKFSAAQWINLKVALAEIVSSGVRRCHLWIDQCLWLNDASQTSWAHTGLIPYVMWPVVTLGSKKFDNDKTVESNTRMWPFVEEIAALWGMGLLTTQEMRSTKVESGSRRHVSYSQRCRLEPEESMRMLLVNVFHGAIDDLQTGWVDDVQELKEMARWNVNADNEHVIVGSDWRSRIAKIDCVSPCSIPYSLTMPFQRKTWSGGFEGNNQYIDGSRKYFGSTWDGLREWLSGNSPARPADEFEDISSIRMSKINVITDRGEYQLLRIDNQYGEPQALWLLVVMDGRSSNFSRGHVAWTKIMCGLSSCELQGAVGDDNVMVTERILSEQVGFAVNIISMKEVDEDIEWT